MAELSLQTILSGVSVAAVVGLASWIYGIANRITTLETKISLYWNMIEDQTSKMLHSPHRPALDRLLEKTRKEGLTQVEATQLVDLLQKLIDTEELSSDERTSALMLMAVTAAKYKISC